MSRLTQQAQDLLDAALSATERGEKCTPMTILIGHDGGIRMCADSDWPLESLAREHGAWTAFRVAQENGRVRVQGREGPHACLLESQSQQGVARLLLR